ncbi:MAG: hypothetical protein IJE22_01225 [Oscillibacter sp.]|nr:hypothetical protein [Oscillibacter sp.]
MLYSDIKGLVLAHIDRYTLQGSPIPPAYSLQSDDEARIPLFVNHGLLTLRPKGELLPAKVKEDFDLGGEEGVIYAACLYAAAALMRTVDEFAYTTLYREFLARANALLTAENGTVEDVYGGGDHG